MKELKEIRINDTNLRLNGNLVTGGILPQKISELTRTVTLTGDTVIDGPVYTAKLVIENGDAEFKGAVFSQKEIYVNTDTKGSVVFRKAVASSQAVTSRAKDCILTFCSDINAKEVTLCNTFVAGSIYADEVYLDGCVVIGGVFATNHIEMKNSIVGTFNSPEVSASGNLGLLLPSAFSQQPIAVVSPFNLFNLSLVDLGSLYRHLPEKEGSGIINMDVEVDDVLTSLRDDQSQRSIHCYTVANKVLMADMLDSDQFQNHFLLKAAALGSQMLKAYGLGKDADGKDTSLSIESIRSFFFDLLTGKVKAQPISCSVSIGQLLDR